VIFRGISNKREYLARTLGQLGVIGLLERAMAARRPALVVLTYHRIGEPGSDRFYDPVISASPHAFHTQMKWLHDRIRILTLEELDAQVQDGGPWRESAAFVTFDDGYRDNFDAAVPILREFKVPATFFIPTEFFESAKLPWWDYVAFVIKKTETRWLNLKRCQRGDDRPISIDLNNVSRRAATAIIVRAFLDETIDDERWFLEQLSMEAGIEVNESHLNLALFMSWDQVRQLINSGEGLTIGSHAHSHKILARLSNLSQQHELSLSKQVLERRLGREVLALAYPYGWPGTYNAVTKLTAKETGYRLGFSSREGVNRRSSFDPLEINRLGVGSSDSLALLRARTALFSALGRSFL
jgi:peptidoglycan/xylan/chitin deacetylase (PgdA/CDA1 family)